MRTLFKAWKYEDRSPQFSKDLILIISLLFFHFGHSKNLEYNLSFILEQGSQSLSGKEIVTMRTVRFQSMQIS